MFCGQLEHRDRNFVVGSVQWYIHVPFGSHCYPCATEEPRGLSPLPGSFVMALPGACFESRHRQGTFCPFHFIAFLDSLYARRNGQECEMQKHGAQGAPAVSRHEAEDLSPAERIIGFALDRRTLRCTMRMSHDPSPLARRRTNVSEKKEAR